jgi:NAD(P)H-nitrite reductase large subunit
VGDHTRAGTGCGTCRADIQALLARTEREEPEPMQAARTA